MTITHHVGRCSLGFCHFQPALGFQFNDCWHIWMFGDVVSAQSSVTDYNFLCLVLGPGVGLSIAIYRTSYNDHREPHAVSIHPITAQWAMIWPKTKLQVNQNPQMHLAVIYYSWLLECCPDQHPNLPIVHWKYKQRTGGSHHREYEEQRKEWRSVGCEKVSTDFTDPIWYHKECW